jgi:hypothetical protein
MVMKDEFLAIAQTFASANPDELIETSGIVGWANTRDLMPGLALTALYDSLEPARRVHRAVFMAFDTDRGIEADLTVRLEDDESLDDPYASYVFDLFSKAANTLSTQQIEACRLVGASLLDPFLDIDFAVPQAIAAVRSGRRSTGFILQSKLPSSGKRFRRWRQAIE